MASTSIPLERVRTGIPRLVVHPEGPASEWKVRLPSDERIGPLLCAFANGVGGRLQVGVSDDGRCVGVTKYRHVIDTLGRLAETRVAPQLELVFDVFPLGRDGRSVVSCFVPAVRDRPVHWLLPDGDELVYVRDGDSTRKATEWEIRRLEGHEHLQGRISPIEIRLMLVLLRERRAEAARLCAAVPCQSSQLGRMLARLLVTGQIFRGLDGRWSLTPEGAQRARRLWQERGGPAATRRAPQRGRVAEPRSPS